MPYGTLKNWNPDRGFGFIKPDDSTGHRLTYSSTFRNSVARACAM